MFKNTLAIPASFYTAKGTKLSFVAYVFLFILCLGFFTPGIVSLPPTDRDESSFAQASKQMIESHDYTDIRLQNEPRYKKPIGIYWLQSAAVHIFSPHHLNQIWAYRIPSFVGATVAVLTTAALGTLLFNAETGVLAALMLAGCVLLNVEARLAKTDATLLACILLNLYGLAFSYKKHASSWKLFLLFWTALAGGILIKGPIILLPLMGVLLWLRVTDKKIDWFQHLRPFYGILYTLVLVAPWFIAISLQSHGDFITQSAGHDLLAKLWQGQNRSLLPPGAHFAALPIVFFPASLFILFALPDIWKNRHDTAVKFCLGWAVPTWVIFELSLTKLPHYVLPAYPALALLASHFLLKGFPVLSKSKYRFRIAGIFALWLIVGFGYAVAFSYLPVFSGNEWNVAQIGVSFFFIVCQGAALYFFPKEKTRSLIVLTIGSLVFISTVFCYTLPRLDHIWLSRDVTDITSVFKRCPKSQIASVGYHEPSLIFLAGTDTQIMTNGGDVARALEDDSCRIALVSEPHIPEFLSAFKGKQPQQLATVEGLNTGHGSKTSLTLYSMPVQLP